MEDGESVLFSGREIVALTLMAIFGTIFLLMDLSIFGYLSGPEVHWVSGSQYSPITYKDDEFYHVIIGPVPTYGIYGPINNSLGNHRFSLVKFEQGNKTLICKGMMADILKNKTSVVEYYDNDNDGKVSYGDEFIVKKKELAPGKYGLYVWCKENVKPWKKGDVYTEHHAAKMEYWWWNWAYVRIIK